jgi:2-amino-4-hydroxy-6-hydroxymethyldihydropteridine diphosphokinase
VRKTPCFDHKVLTMKIAYLGLGSNLGDRQANLADAVKLLPNERLKVKRTSSIWETEPRDILDQPWFLNQVVEIETDLFPRQLFQHLQRIEREMGRIKRMPKGPRLIDLDILLYGSAVVKTRDLEIPHPRMTERRFVLAPLAELAPDLRHPMLRKTMRELLAVVAGQSAKKAE